MDVLLILLWPLGYFARNPVLCGLLAAVFSIPVLLPFYRLRSRLALAVCAAAWWGFCWQEAVRPEDAEVVADLLRFGPVFLLTAIGGAWHLAVGHRPENGPLRPARQRPEHRRRRA